MRDDVPLTRDLVLIGGGHAHALVLRKWGMDPLPGVRVTLINPGPTAPYSGMLPGHVAGHYTRDELDIDLVRLGRFAGARLILGEAVGIDPVAQTVRVAGRGEIGYDVASLDVGIHARMPQIEGFAEHATAAKPLDVFAARWREFLERAAAGRIAPEVAVIGGGVAGVELSMAMAHALRSKAGRAQVTLIEAGARITRDAPGLRPKLLRRLDMMGVKVLTGAEVVRVAVDAVHLAQGEAVPSRFTLGAAGAFAHPWLADGALPVTEAGFVRVGIDLRVEGHKALFAVGDCAHLIHAPRPKTGVYAVRAAPVLYDNLRATLSAGAMRSFRPQQHYLKLISLGGKSALAGKWGLGFAHPVLWRWKDRIDRDFMDRFRDYPEMKRAPLPEPLALGVRDVLQGQGQPLCGGCGAKVGPGTLRDVLAGLPRAGRADVLSGPGDDAAVLLLGGMRQVVTTDHLRAFTEDPGLLARIAAVHALGDIWAMGAAPQAALMQIILPRMAEPLQARSMAEIMGAAAEVLQDVGAEIVGGHSTMGAETTVGFTLTGLLEGEAITHAGAQPGDALILTRPIGTGTLLAGEMQRRANGRDVARMLEIMARPQGDAAAILAKAHAMTDVTGFGLAGHLMAICTASDVAADLDLQAIPVYCGAIDLAEAGIRSTIHEANRAAAPVAGAAGARGALLHDPQTAGGLLAAVAAGEADEILTALRAAGHAAALIGRIVAGPPGITCNGASD